MLIERRITFILPKDGIISWKLDRLKTLVGMFRSVALFLNITQWQQANIEQRWQVMALGSKENDLCQLHIEGLDAELACIVLTDFIAEQFILVNMAYNSKKNRLKPNATLLEWHPAFRLPFVLNYHFEPAAFLSEERFVYSELADTGGFLRKTAIIKKISQQICQTQAITKNDELQHAFLKREAISATMISKGIALPHIVSEHIKTPSLIVVRSTEGIMWRPQLEQNNSAYLILAFALPVEPPKPLLLSFIHFSRSLLNGDFSQLLLSTTDPEILKAILIHRLSAHQ